MLKMNQKDFHMSSATQTLLPSKRLVTASIYPVNKEKDDRERQSRNYEELAMNELVISYRNII